jgi:MFS family permease
VTTGRSAAVPAWWGLGVLIAITLFGYVDRQIFVLMAEPIRISMGLSDTQLGMLQGLGIALFGAVAAYPIGWLADRYDRRVVLGICIMIWSAAVIGCGLAPDFTWLFLFSAMLGAGEAGLIPIVFAMIPQMFTGSARMLANSVYTVATQLGVGLAGAFCAGLIVWIAANKTSLPVALGELEDWRLIFIMIGASAPVVLLLLMTVRMGRSKASPITVDTNVLLTTPHDVTLGSHLQIHRRTVAGFFLGYGLATFGFASIIAWIPAITIRLYGVTPAYAGAMTGTITIVATIVGFLLGIVTMRIFSPRFGPRFPIVIIWVATASAALTTMMLLAATSALAIYILQGLQFALIMGAFVIFPTALQDIAPAAIRARVIALSNVVRMVIGALSPVAVGMMSDWLGPRPDGLLISAVTMATGGLGFGALAFWWASGSYAATAEASRD